MNMKSFQKFISEEVLPTAMVQDGNFDLRNEAVRDQINAILSGICSRSHVTPYITLRKVSKALAYFSIILPKKTFLEGQKGIEVYEMVQFGEKMGMNDSGEFIREVPPTYYLFFDYRGMLGMFSCMAKVVDKAELDKMLDMAEITMKECADDKATMSQRSAEKEPMHDVTSDEKKKGNKEAVADSEKGLNEVSLGKLVRYRKGAEQELGDIKHFKKNPGQYPAATSDDAKAAGRREKTREKGISLAHKKMTGKAKVGASAPKHPYMEETVEEGRMPASVIKHKQRIANMTPEEKAKKFAGKSDEQLKSMARRHGYGKDSTEYSKHVKEEQIDEKAPPGAKFERMVKHIKKGYSKDGLTAKEKSIAFATAWKAKKKEQMDEAMGSVKKASAFRTMKRKVSTQVKAGLGVEGPSKTIQVAGKNDPERKVRRISKDKFDPSKHVKV
jgi:hypothetical protein